MMAVDPEATLVKIPRWVIILVLGILLSGMMSGMTSLWARVREIERGSAAITSHMADQDRWMERMEKKIDKLADKE